MSYMCCVCAHLSGAPHTENSRCEKCKSANVFGLRPSDEDTIRRAYAKEAPSKACPERRGPDDCPECRYPSVVSWNFCPSCGSEKDGEPISYKFSEKPPIEKPEPPTEKIPFELLDLDFAIAMCENWKAGIKGTRTANGWRELEHSPEVRAEYVAKVLRHLAAYVRCDHEGEVEEAGEHAAAIACNANILWAKV